MQFREFVCSQWEPAILPTLKFSTQRNYRHLVRRHLFPTFGDQPMCNITRQHIQRFVTDKMTRQKFCWKTSLHLRNLLSTIFSTAVHWEYIPLNPATGVKLPPRPLRVQLRFLTTDEVSRLLSALEDPGLTLVLMAVLTGMRIGELLPGGAKAELRCFSWHDFRRTHATLLSDMGEPLKTAQAQLGHASLSTTAEIYARAVPASQRAAVERLEKAVGSLVDPKSRV
jgi:integrase